MSRRSERRRWLGLPVGLIVLVATTTALIGWNRVASSPSFCASCHAMRPAVVSAAGSVHARVPCLACHARPGLIGTLRYVPTLVAEGIGQATNSGIARNVLPAAPCARCHADVGAARQANGGRHPPVGSACTACHGEVAHPQRGEPAPSPAPSPTIGIPHPQGWSQTHGRESAASPASCATCHQPEFCTACHIKTNFPHPDGWIGTHGTAQEKEGPSACTMCHPSTFCAGCHGTEIPHPADWLGQHFRALQGASDSPCYVCHPQTDCSSCHVRHQVHREQDLYG